jgi:4-amino-4-deoxy-L-arabinose transferase-like glycosyltransferase
LVTSTSSAVRSQSRFLRRLDVLALVALLGVAAFLFSLGLDDRTNYDEGVYLASLDALRHGQELGRDVFASQPPGFYVLLRLLGLFAGRSIEGIRIGMLVLALVGVGAVYLIGRELAGPFAGVAAAALVIAAPPYAAEAPRVQADLPAIALALVALALAARSFRPGRIWGPALAGAIAAASVSVKLLALPVAVPLVVLGVRRRVGARATGTLLGGALTVVAALAIAYAGVLPELWHQAVGFHWDARSIGGGESHTRRIVDYFGLHTPTTWAAAAAVCAALFLRRQLVLWLWVAAAIAFLLLQKPLLDHHFVLLAAALAAAAGASLGSARGRLGIALLAVAGVTAVAGWVQDYRQIDRSTQPEPAEIRAAVHAVRALTRPSELVASDLPIVPYLADRREPGRLVDTSAVRFASGSLTPQDVRRARARVYVAGREFLRHPDSIRGLTVVRTIGTIKILARR